MPNYPKRIRNTKTHRQRALQELDIDVPYYACRLVSNRLEFYLYGGAVVRWPPVPEPEPAPGPGDDEE
jgi:hypothetical protein